MIFLDIILPASLMLLIGIYVYFYIKRIIVFLRPKTDKLSVKKITAISTAVIMIPALYVWGVWAIVILHLFVLAVCMDFVNYVVKKVGKKKNYSFLEKIYKSGIIPIISTVLVLIYGYWNIGNVIKTEYTVYTDKNIRDEGYKIAMISDLHFGITMDVEKLKEYSKKIEEVKPDIVVLDGDIVDENTKLEEMQAAISILGSIKSKFGTFYVYGNHERGLYSISPNFTEEQLESVIEASGINSLRDKTYRINEDMNVIGREDKSYTEKGERKSGEELIKGVNKEDFLLMLDHQPIELEKNSKLGYDLMLSGHTHGGQIWPAGLLTNLIGAVELNYGYKKIDDFQVIVSSGIAGWGYPIRTQNHSEYVLINLKKNK